MDLLFHTIAVEPARWTPQRTSQDLITLLPRITAAGFTRLEIFEPHLTSAPISADIQAAFQSLNLTPEILSSYLNLNPAAASSTELDAAIEVIRARISFYGFRRMRLFPGPAMDPSDKDAITAFTTRLERLITALPDTEILLETHDGSLADDPATITQIVRDLNAPTVALLYQPTIMKPEPALAQFALQLPYIRHVHLQNRQAEGSFSTLQEGVVPWPQIISQLSPTVTATLEFVPIAICPVEQFDLATTLAQAKSEAAYFRTLSLTSPAPGSTA